MKLRFGSFELDTERYVLRAGGEPRAVEPKVFDLIAFLARHPDRVFSRDQLIEHVWAGRVVSDATVSTCVKSARKTLGDGGGARRYIETVRGRGFRFVAEVAAQAVDGRDMADNVRPPTDAATGIADPSLLVLPFRALPQGTEASLLAEALTGDLGSVLTRIPLLRLSAQVSRYANRDLAPTAREIHEELGVDFVLEGAAHQAGDGFRVNVQLSDARSGFSLWSRRFPIAGPVAAAIETAVMAVISKLEPQLHRAIYDRVRSSREEPTARALYLEASGVLALKGWRHQSFQQAADLLRRSRRLDAQFALAPAYLALVMGLGQRVGLMVQRETARAEALEAAECALELDGMDSTVLGFAGCALADIGYPDRALPILRNAVDLEPANAQAWAALGSVCLIKRDLASAITHLRHGITISPLDSRLSVWGALLALAHMLSDDLDAALEQAELACQRDDRCYLPRVVLAAVHVLRGELDQCAGVLDDALRIKPDLSDRQVSSLVGSKTATRLLEIRAMRNEPP